MAKDFEGAFRALRAILRKHARGLVVQADEPAGYVVITEAIAPNRKPLWFGAVLSKKSAVSFHLVPLYYNPALQAQVDPDLLARKHGKTCFNFQRPEPALFAKLDALTASARRSWEGAGFLEPGLISQEKLDAALRAAGEDPERIAQQRRAKAKAVVKERTVRSRSRSRSRSR